jgi:hypothetical protein
LLKPLRVSVSLDILDLSVLCMFVIIILLCSGAIKDFTSHFCY